MSGIEQRSVRRIPRHALPEALHHLSMVFGSGRKTPVEIYDASTMGLGLVVPLSVAEFSDDTTVMLEPGDQSFQLVGEIVFVIGHLPGESRVGVHLTQSISISTYLELLGEDFDQG